jgi:hypothetical protein
MDVGFVSDDGIAQHPVGELGRSSVVRWQLFAGVGAEPEWVPVKDTLSVAQCRPTRGRILVIHPPGGAQHPFSASYQTRAHLR